MRKLASIATIATAEPIPEADRLDVVTLEGKAWRIVTGRNEFKPGDRAVYFEIDSALPADDERFAFLHDRCLRTWSDKHGNALKQAVRIRTVKLKGVISQGLVMPIGIFPELAGRSIGDDVTSDLRVEHFDEISEQMRAALLAARLPDHPEVTVEYFVPDDRKAGGAYVTVTGRVRHISVSERLLVMEDGTVIPLEDIVSIASKIF